MHWKELYDIAQKDIKESGLSDKAVAMGLLARQRGSKGDPKVNDAQEAALDQLGWLLLDRCPNLMPGTLTPTLLALQMMALGQQSLSELVALATSTEAASVEEAASRLGGADDLYNRAVAFLTAGDHLSAIVDFTSALRLAPQDVQSLFNRAHAYWQVEAYDLAFEDWGLAITFKPDYTNAWMRRGMGYYMVGAADPAITNLTKALELGGPEWPSRTEVLEVIQSIRDELASSG